MYNIVHGLVAISLYIQTIEAQLVMHPNINHQGSIPQFFLAPHHIFLECALPIEQLYLPFPSRLSVAKSALWSTADLSCTYHKPHALTLHRTMHHLTITTAPTPAPLPHYSFISFPHAQPHQHRSPPLQCTTTAAGEGAPMIC